MAPAEGPGPRHTHGLGPHVVGERIVVRRLLAGETGPTGGPAFTDVLGVCESWGDGIAHVRREDGTVVAIPTAEIVSGKPVPPRPSARQRVSVRDAESHAAPLWPGVERVPLGEWELRHEPHPVDRARKRANSCLAIGDPGMPFADAAARVVAHYAERGRPAMVQVQTGSAEDWWFTDAGWPPVEGGDAHLMLGSLARARRRLPAVDLDVREEFDGPRVTVTAPGLGSGRAAVDGDWLGVHDLHVAETARRRGVARALMAALLDLGAERGATTVWLHVETGNEAAIALYEGLGLAVHHTCRYLVSTGSTTGAGP